MTPLVRDRASSAVSFGRAALVCRADGDAGRCPLPVSCVADIGVAEVRDLALELFGPAVG